MSDQPTPPEGDVEQQLAEHEQQLMLSNPTVMRAMAGYLQHRNIQLALRVHELEAAAAEPRPEGGA